MNPSGTIALIVVGLCIFVFALCVLLKTQITVFVRSLQAYRDGAGTEGPADTEQTA